MRVALRPIRDDDAPFLLRVYAGTRAEELAVLPWSADEKAAFLAQQFSAQSADYAQHYDGMSADVILVDGVPAGRMLVHRRPGEIRIVDIALLPKLRGRGAGTVLLRALLNEAAAARARVSIHVQRSSPALALYERLGFRRVGEQDDFYLRMEWTAAADAPYQDTTDSRSPVVTGSTSWVVSDGNATSVPGSGTSVSGGSSRP